MTGTDNIHTYAEFWPFYLSQHRRRATRLIHIVGTLLGLCAIALAILAVNAAWLILALGVGYGCAWIGHSLFEKNEPATFTHPLWSLRGDFHMLGIWLSGGLEPELIKYKIMT